MKKSISRVLLLLVLVSAVYASVNDPVEDTNTAAAGKEKAPEASDRFIPSEKIKADDAIAFPVDI